MLARAFQGLRSFFFTREERPKEMVLVTCPDCKGMRVWKERCPDCFGKEMEKMCFTCDDGSVRRVCGVCHGSRWAMVEGEDWEDDGWKEERRVLVREEGEEGDVNVVLE
jgi:hypothetical protein